MNKQRRSIGNSRQSIITDIDPMAEKCARYIICREGSKIPIKKEDIKKHLGSSDNMAQIIDKARNILKRVYGYNLVELNNEKRKGQFIVILDKECTQHDKCFEPNHRRLLNATLTHIYMTGTDVSENDLGRFLTLAEFIPQNDQEWKRIFKTFVKQLYLDTYKDEKGDIFYKWGERAELEVPKMFIVNKLAQALNVNPRIWSDQYRCAKEQEEQYQQTEQYLQSQEY